jgi:hypothetical protein
MKKIKTSPKNVFTKSLMDNLGVKPIKTAMSFGSQVKKKFGQK